MKRDKIVGFRNFRADVRLQIRVNTNPMVSGRIVVGYYAPNLYNNGNGVDVFGNAFFYGTSLTSLTGCPHVDIDLASGEGAELVIPYYNSTSHWDMTQVDPSDPALSSLPTTLVLFVVAYTNIDVPSGVASLQLLAGLENVDLSFPTYPTRQLAGARSLFQKELQDAGVDEEKARVLSSGISKDHYSFTQQGLVADIAGVVGNVANTVAPLTSGVPILGGIVNAAGAVAGPFAKIAGALGFSKELHNEPPSTTEIIMSKYSQNMDGLDSSRVIGLSSANTLANDAAVCSTEEDEMSFAYMFKRPEFFQMFDWDSATQPAGSKLVAFKVDPMICNQKFPATSYTNGRSPPADLISPTHLAYVAHMFNYWRGSLKYHFKFAKTAFHVGRVRILWLPGDQDPNYDPAVTYATGSPEASYFHQMIVDLRETSEAVFEVPFSSNRPFNFCEGADFASEAHPDYGSNGTIIVQAMTSLSAPSSVAQKIQCAIEIQAGEDFELAMFKGNPWMFPTAQGDFMSYGVGGSTMTSRNFVARGDETYGGINEYVQQSNLGIASDKVASTELPDSPLDVASTCMGERINSVRALTKIFQLNSIINWSKSTTDPTEDSNKYVRPLGLMISPQAMMPHYSEQVVSAMSTNDNPPALDWATKLDGMNAQTNHMPDILDAFSVCYGFWKGSTRAKIVQRNGGYSTALVTYRPSSTMLGEAGFPTAYDRAGFSSPVFPCTGDESSFASSTNNNTPFRISKITESTHETVIANDIEARDIQLQIPYYQPLTMTRTGTSTQYAIKSGAGNKASPAPLFNAHDNHWYMPHNIYRIVYEQGDPNAKTSNRPVQFRYYRAAADDFRFHLLQGVPMMSRLDASRIGGVDTTSFGGNQQFVHHLDTSPGNESPTFGST